MTMSGRMGLGKKSGFSKLRRFVREAPEVAEAALEHCDLCGEAIPPEHRHLLNISTRDIVCSCQACSILFHNEGAGEYRVITDRTLRLEDFDMSDAEWDGLGIPVNMAFFFHNSSEGRVMALYPSPAGPTESTLELTTWEDLEKRNPILESMKPDIEALLVNRVRDTREYFLAPIDKCYELVGVIRAYWRGLSGGREVAGEIEKFFDDLRSRSKTPKKDS